MLQISMREVNVKQLNFSSRAIGFINFENTFSKFYRRHYELISILNAGLNTFLREGLSERKFYSELVYKFKALLGTNDFSY